MKFQPHFRDNRTLDLCAGVHQTLKPASTCDECGSYPTVRHLRTIDNRVNGVELCQTCLEMYETYAETVRGMENIVGVRDG